MKKLILLFTVTVLSINGYCQQGQWTWMNGSDLYDQGGVWGTQGIFDSLNTPPGVYEPCEWTDKQGYFWLFGGVDVNINVYSSLWKFNPAFNQWAWIKGGSNFVAVYGTQNIPSPLNDPGPRSFGIATWVDTSGNLWLFGGRDGNGLNYLNDLWKYDIATNEWTWIAGPTTVNDTGNYGTRLIPSPLNNPPSRAETNATWTDADNNLWLFGGYAYGGINFSDMWKFNISTNEWTWMKGYRDNNAVYGIKGVPDSANLPGARGCYAKWMDCEGNFWLFGGGEFSFNRVNNDMWKFNPSTNEWTWMSGTTVYDDYGLYGPECVSDTAYLPQARYENRACWMLNNENFVNFGGDDAVNDGLGFKDLWCYNIITNKWTLMDAYSALSSYGTKTVSSPANLPPKRLGSVGWKDNNGYLWFFGGDIGPFHCYNDMWRFIPDSTCPSYSLIHSISSFNVQPATGCDSLTVQFTNSSIYATSLLWDFGDGNTSTNLNPVHFYNDTGTYIVRLIAYNYCEAFSDTSYFNSIMIAGPNSVISSFTVDTLSECEPLIVHFTNYSTYSTSYLWHFGDGGASTLANPSHLYGNSGNYTVTLIAYDSTACGVFTDTLSQTFYFTVFIPPTAPTITQHGDTLISSYNSGNQWYLFTNAIPGATDSIYIVSHTGCYHVNETDSNGCEGKSDTVCFSFAGIKDISNSYEVSIFPNPNDGMFTLSYSFPSSGISNYELRIMDVLGRTVYTQSITYPNQTIINISKLSDGVYFYQLSNNKKTLRGKFVKE